MSEEEKFLVRISDIDACHVYSRMQVAKTIQEITGLDLREAYAGAQSGRMTLPQHQAEAIKLALHGIANVEINAVNPHRPKLHIKKSIIQAPDATLEDECALDTFSTYDVEMIQELGERLRRDSDLFYGNFDL